MICNVKKIKETLQFSDDDILISIEIDYAHHSVCLLDNHNNREFRFINSDPIFVARILKLLEIAVKEAEKRFS